MIDISNFINWELKHNMIDDDGRFLVLSGQMNSEQITIVGVYAPYVQQQAFWEKI